VCRNSVHKVADLARPQCLIKSEIYYNSVEQIYVLRKQNPSPTSDDGRAGHVAGIFAE
jgi:hypothetical protein